LVHEKHEYKGKSDRESSSKKRKEDKKDVTPRENKKGKRGPPPKNLPKKGTKNFVVGGREGEKWRIHPE